MNVDDMVGCFAATREKTSSEYELRSRLRAGFLGVATNGQAAFLLPLAHSNVPAGRVIGSIRMAFVEGLEFQIEGESWSQSAAIIQCLDARLLRTFCCVVQDVADRLDATEVSAKQVIEALRSWDKLLRRRDCLSPEEELGLWGELSLVLDVANVDAVLETWQGPSGGTMDFVGGGIAIECKATFRKLHHRVSESQASFDGMNVKPFLASLFVAEDHNAGRTLPDMIEEVVRRSSDETAVRTKLLAAGYRDEHRDEYRRKLTRLDEPTLFPMGQVPRVHQWDPGISNIRYDLDLTHLTPLPAGACAEAFRELIGKTT